MTVRNSILAGVAFLALGATSSQAADLFGGKGGSIKDGGYQTEIVPSRPHSWYLRGDFSFAGNDLGGIRQDPNYVASEVSIDRNWAFGGGVGYYFSKSVRGDLTLEGRSTAKTHGKIFYGPGFNADTNVGLRSTVGLANLYYDFDMRSHFTPYLGVGLGFASNKTSDSALSGCCTAPVVGATKTSAAGALMAGFSAKVADRVNFDAGYRFLYLGDATTGLMQSTPVTTRPALHLEDISAHEFRVGLRVDIR